MDDINGRADKGAMIHKGRYVATWCEYRWGSSPDKMANYEFTETDVKIVVTQARVERDHALNALHARHGNLQEAIDYAKLHNV